MIRVTAGARLHFGFTNLSLARDRLYGALGVALAEPRLVVEAAATDRQSVDITVTDDGVAAGVRADLADDLRTYVARARELLGADDGIDVRLEEALPRHAGLGSGTQLALAALAAVARVGDHAPAVRERAPQLGRGGRSGVGVAAFERGGFVLDGGHPTARFTTDRPADGSWEVPAVTARHPVPTDWRFLLVLPDAPPGRNGTEEDAAMRSVVERADPDVADGIAGLVVRDVLPAVAEGRTEAFGEAVAEVGRRNGAWYADEQGGVFRPPVGDLVASLTDDPAVRGAGQSSWGPTVYGVTDADRADAAREAGERALDVAGVDGTVRVVGGRNRGARIEE